VVGPVVEAVRVVVLEEWDELGVKVQGGKLEEFEAFGATLAMLLRMLVMYCSCRSVVTGRLS
jgi:hypothetical protein